jgi:hypothetical protein
MIGDLCVLWEMVRAEARQSDRDEEEEMRETCVWVLAVAFLAVAGLISWCLWSMSGSLAEIAGKL